jgi:hypothetical protein
MSLTINMEFFWPPQNNTSETIIVDSQFIFISLQRNGRSSPACCAFLNFNALRLL